MGTYSLCIYGLLALVWCVWVGALVSSSWYQFCCFCYLKIQIQKKVMNYSFAVMFIGFKRKGTQEILEPEKLCFEIFRRKGWTTKRLQNSERRWMPLGSSLSHRNYGTFKQPKFVIARKNPLFPYMFNSIPVFKGKLTIFLNVLTWKCLFHFCFMHQVENESANFEKYVSCLSGLINYFQIRFSDSQEDKRN